MEIDVTEDDVAIVLKNEEEGYSFDVYGPDITEDMELANNVIIGSAIIHFISDQANVDMIVNNFYNDHSKDVDDE